jgi:hypothetical protein
VDKNLVDKKKQFQINKMFQKSTKDAVLQDMENIGKKMHEEQMKVPIVNKFQRR